MNVTDKNILKEFLALFLPYKTKIFLIIGCLLAYTLTSLLIPILNKSLIDDGLLANNLFNVVFFASAILVTATSNSLLDLAKEKLRSVIAYNIGRELYLRAFKDLLSIKVSYFDKKNPTEIYNDLTVDINSIESICSPSIFSSVAMLLSFLGGMTGLFIIEWRLAFIVILFIPVKYYLIKYFGKKREDFYSDLIKSSNTLGHWFGDNLNGMKEIRLLGIKKEKIKELDVKVSKVCSIFRRLNILDALNITSEMFFMRFIDSMITVAGAILIFDEGMTVGSLFAFLTYSAQVMSPISMIINIKYHLVGILPSARRYYSFLEEAAQNREPVIGEPVSVIQDISFENVYFSYGDHQVLNNVSFAVNQGEKAALVGRNGTGKTTVFNLIERFAEPGQGHVFSGGKDISSYSVDAWRERLGVINQSSHVFDLSILDNIALYSTLSDEQLRQIVGKCDLREVCAVNTDPIGQNGCHISGGQRQKLLFARMMAYPKDFYLLDEATSNLDTTSEGILLDLLDNELRGKTLIMITHNIRILNKMDKIIQLRPNSQAVTYSGYKQFIAAQSLTDDDLIL